MRAALLVLVSLALFALGSLSAQPKSLKPREGELQVGKPGVDFVVQDVAGKKTVKLADLKGKPVVLIFGSCT